jgi:uncharacterized protein (TIGR03067 family)
MHIITYISLIIFGINFASIKNSEIKPDDLTGTWIPVKQEINGVAMPKAVFENQKLVLTDSTYTFSAESVDKGIVKYNGDKMDIYGKEGVNTGKHFAAIYKLENDELTICYNLSGDSYPESFETKGKPKFFLSVFKKE